MAGVVDIHGGVGEDLHDVVHRRADPVPTLAAGPGIIAPGDGVRDVGRRHPIELGAPHPVGRQPPEGGEDPNDRPVPPIALHQSKLAGEAPATRRRSALSAARRPTERASSERAAVSAARA